MKTFKTFVLAAIMAFIGTSNTFAHKNPELGHDKHHHTTIVVKNDRHHNHYDAHRHDIHNHRHINRHDSRCMCRKCKRMHYKMEKRMRKMERIRHGRHHNTRVHIRH